MKKFMLTKVNMGGLAVLQIAAMLIQQTHIGLGILQAAQHSRDMFECTVGITWYNIYLRTSILQVYELLFYLNHVLINS